MVRVNEIASKNGGISLEQDCARTKELAREHHSAHHLGHAVENVRAGAVGGRTARVLTVGAATSAVSVDGLGMTWYRRARTMMGKSSSVCGRHETVAPPRDEFPEV